MTRWVGTFDRSQLGLPNVGINSNDIYPCGEVERVRLAVDRCLMDGKTSGDVRLIQDVTLMQNLINTSWHILVQEAPILVFAEDEVPRRWRRQLIEPPDEPRSLGLNLWVTPQRKRP